MLVNPSIYNGLGKYNKNVELTSLERRNGPSAMTKRGEEARLRNSLTEFINAFSYRQMSQFDNQFSNDLKMLNQSAKALAQTKSEVYKGREAIENTGSFDVSVQAGASLGKKRFSVNALATQQSNLSSSKPASGAFGGSGKDLLVIEQGKRKTSITIERSMGDSYEDYLNKTAKAVNDSQSGVKASVKVDALGYAQLSLESKDAGTENSFKLSGSVNDTLQLSEKETQATDLQYTLDGKDGTAKSNTLSLEDGKITLTAKAVSTEEDSFEVTKSSKAIASQLKNFAEAYNRFVDNQKENDNPLTQSLVKQLSGIVKRTVDDIGVAGIDLDSQGKITLDETQLNASIAKNPEAVEKALTRYDSLSSAIARKTDQIQSTPNYQLAPRFNNSATTIKAYMYNYTAQSTLNNINQLTYNSSMIDVKI